ncbi:general substrate transporter [Sistotremastrum niveocremeum HHB9708]|uniref:General substrate transporter n=1 Tax=Sistotremastrum niveocremeum HHB9708 TaxID=1314777 RepID=A0A164WW09_9AGAM|nr:general substrate transporter [Sistotremastrum niveocremeum HHB9708]
MLDEKQGVQLSEKVSNPEHTELPLKPDAKVLNTAKDSRLAQALLEERPNLLSKNSIKLFCVLFVSYLCSAQNGFDSNTFGGVSALPDFKAQFGTNIASTTGFLAAIYIIGNVIGSFVAGPCADRWGRKVGMFIASFITLIGAIVQASAENKRDLIAGRVVLGVGTVMLGPSAQSYAVEMSHPGYRGLMVGAFQACFFLGTIISTWVEYGLSFNNSGSTINWRLPMALQALPSIGVLLFVYFIPESPRWYMAQGQQEKARAILVKYHGNDNPNSKIVQLEMEEMEEVISTTGSDKRWWDYTALFKSRSARHRTFIVLCVGFFGQLDLPPTSYYFPLMVQTAGITSTRSQLLCNALQTPIMMISTLAGIQFIDRWGRRRMLMTSSVCMTICVAIIIACTATQTGHAAIGLTGIAFIYVFLVVFAFVWTPCQALYPTEVLTTNTRAKGLALNGLWMNIISFINTYAAPVGITRSSWRFYLLYLIIDAVGVIVIYFTFVETRGRNLEELDAIFDDPHPVTASLAMQKVVVREDQMGGVLVQEDEKA